MFLALKPPFRPLAASSIGRITQNYLKKLGVPMGIFGPHSTRGAGVKMFKNLGLSSEVVCEVGGWKNPTAFSAHYLRLDAAQSAGDKVNDSLVHRVPPYEGVEQERSSRVVGLTWV